MCLHRSYVVTEDYKVLSSKRSDHHTDIRKEHSIRDDMHNNKVENVSIEYRPEHELFDPSSWTFIFDGGGQLTSGVKPKWWTKEHRDKVNEKLAQDFMKYSAIDSTYVFPGELDLRALKYLNRENTTIIAEGSVFLGVELLPPSTTIISKRGSVELLNCNRVYENCTVVSREMRIGRVNPRSINFVCTDRRRQEDHHYSTMYGYRIYDSVDTTTVMQVAPIKP